MYVVSFVLQDLIPILVGCGDSPLLRNDVIRLLVNLTQPAYLCFGGTFPKGKDSDMMKCFMEVNRSAISHNENLPIKGLFLQKIFNTKFNLSKCCRYLRVYKEAFTEENVMYVLGSVLADLCQKVTQQPTSFIIPTG